MIKQFEGCRLTAYLCPAGVWTIGYGHTAGVKKGQVITQEQADNFLKDDLEKYEKYVISTGLSLNQNQFDALVSFTYNCGQGNLKKLIKGRTLAEIADAMLLYNKGGGKVLAGLVKRRKAEQQLFLSGGSVQKTYPTLRMGSRGSDVVELQQFLIEKGYSLKADGLFGAKTLEAVRAYQADNGLAIDGIVGKNTWSSLMK